jgi:plastocyanin
VPKKLLVVLVTALSLFACADEDPDVVITDEDAEVVQEDDDDREVAETPLEEIDECNESSAAEGAPVGVTMSDNFFEPPCIAVSSTQTITLTNAGNLDHNFTVEEGDYDIDVESGGEETTDEVGTDLTAGVYKFYCDFHQADGMVGTLVVE